MTTLFTPHLEDTKDGVLLTFPGLIGSRVFKDRFEAQVFLIGIQREAVRIVTEHAKQSHDIWKAERPGLVLPKGIARYSEALWNDAFFEGARTALESVVPIIRLLLEKE